MKEVVETAAHPQPSALNFDGGRRNILGYRSVSSAKPWLLFLLPLVVLWG